MTDKPDSLPNRMREAAKVLEEADRRCYGRIDGWTPSDLNGTADAWEAENRAAAEREALEWTLANQIAAGFKGMPSHPMSVYLGVAQGLIASGWTKDAAPQAAH